jgi:hypothetical protein
MGASKVMPPILLRRSTTFEVDVGGVAVEVHPTPPIVCKFLLSCNR